MGGLKQKSIDMSNDLLKDGSEVLKKMNSS